EVSRVLVMEQELREHWTVTSTRMAVLTNANKTLSRKRARSTDLETGFAAIGGVDLNGWSLELRLEDESAKLSVPGAFRDFPRQQAASLIDRTIRFRPAARLFDWQQGNRDRLDIGSLMQQGWASFLIPPAQVESNASSILKGTDELTLWGRGRINVFAASPDVIGSAWQGLLGTFPPRSIMEASAARPRPNWQELVRELDLRQDQLQKVNRWFTTGSEAFSLELQCTRGDRREIYLFVDSPNQAAGFRLQ
ncbi:MAG: hypothetical protein AAGG44_13155, partial [Planctomycetota bacterium]